MKRRFSWEKVIVIGKNGLYCHLYDLAPLRKYFCVYWEENESFSSTTEAVDTAIHNASVIQG